MCPIACLLNPLTAHYTHISHRNILKAQWNMMYKPTCMLLQGSCVSHAVHCKVPLQPFVWFFIDKCFLLSLKHMLTGVCTQSALGQTRQRLT